jgi:hypothetical protein
VARLPRGSIRLYAGLVLVFVASFTATWLLPVSELFKGLASIPGVAAMASIVIQIWRDQRAHERALDLLNRQQDFALATASHMANIAYDKHVIFCEAYIERTNRGVRELMVSGPSKDVLDFAGELMDLRLRHTAWLTTEIESKLMPFEAALRRMGAGELVLPNLRVGEGRSRVVDDIYKAFGVIVGAAKPATDEERATASAEIVDHIRDVLGIKELTALRQASTRLALQRLSERNETV